MGELVKQSEKALTALEPRDLNEAMQMSKILFESRLLPDSIKTPQAAFVIMMKGRELGLTAMQSFGSINIISGKVECSAELIIGRVKASGLAKYFRLVESTEAGATYETERIGEGVTKLSFTMDDARKLGLADKANYRNQPKTMLRWRCASALAKTVYPDVVLGLYTYGELTAQEADESRETHPHVITASEIPLATEEDDAALVQRYTAELKAAATPEALAKVMEEIKPLPESVKAPLRELGKSRKVQLAKPQDSQP